VRWREWRLEDGDLLLRPWEDGDRELIGVSMRDPEIGRYFGRALGSPEDAPRPAIADPDAPAFAIVVSGDVVGRIWCRPGARPFEIGYFLHPGMWGKGFATRSLRWVSTWLLTHGGAAQIDLCTHPDNVKSQQVAERAGSRRDGVIDESAHFRDGSTRALRFVLTAQDLDVR
jgi:RimJ/RimL family protein N-acetyltransferase